jgi:hypothetical protein
LIEYETDTDYRHRLIEEAVSIIINRARAAGIEFSLTEDSVTNIATIIVDRVLEKLEESKKLQVLTEESVAEKAAEDNKTVDSVDISKNIEEFYDK